MDRLCNLAYWFRFGSYMPSDRSYFPMRLCGWELGYFYYEFWFCGYKTTKIWVNLKGCNKNGNRWNYRFCYISGYPEDFDRNCFTRKDTL